MTIINYSNKHLYGPLVGTSIFTVFIAFSSYNIIGLMNSLYIALAGIILGYWFYKIRVRGSFLEVNESAIILVGNYIKINDIVEIKTEAFGTSESPERQISLICRTKKCEYKYSLSESSLNVSIEKINDIIHGIKIKTNRVH